MILWLISTTFLCLATWVYNRWWKVKNFWAERGVPHLPPHPIFGSLTFLQQMNPAEWMLHMYEKFDAPYIGMWNFWRPALIINSPEIARKVLVKDFANFRNRFLNSASHDSLGSLNIFTTNDPLWSDMRRRLSPVFTSFKLRGIQNLISSKGKELVQRIAIESKKGRFNIRTVYNDYTTDIASTASFGVKGDATLTGSSPMRAVTKDFENYTFYRGLSWICIFFFPELVGIFRFTFFPMAAGNFFRKIFYKVMEQRKQDTKDITEARDLLDILLKMKEDSIKENNEIPDEVILAQAAILLQGGFDTSGTLLTFATYELAYQPDIQEKLYNELKAERERIGDADFDSNTLSELTYLNCVIKESLRKYQPMAWLDRVALRDYAIDDKLTIPAGTPTYVNVAGMHYDPNYFPDPTKFDPDRFLPENEANIKKFTFIPFGEGPRSCIGQRFGFTNLRYGISSIILNYKLRPYPNTLKPTEIPMERNSMFLIPGVPLYLEFIPRN